MARKINFNFKKNSIPLVCGIKLTEYLNNIEFAKNKKCERRPYKPILELTSIAKYPGQIVHLDLVYINHKIALTSIDKFSKYAQVKIVKSRGVEDLKESLRELLTSLGFLKQIVVDKEKFLAPASIKFMLDDQYGIEIYKALSYVMMNEMK